jgi:hypothetical protein
MAARHGTANRYNQGCRCDDCKDSHRLRAAAYRARRAKGLTRPAPVQVRTVPMSPREPNGSPGPVEVGVLEEIGGLAAEARPGLAQVALAMARILDNPRAINQQPSAAKVLASLLEKLRSASAGGRRGGLRAVRTMTEKGGA